MPFIPHTEQDISEMLAAIGLNSLQELFKEIPSSLRFNDFDTIPSVQTEAEMLREAAQFAQQNNNGICFLGAGAYQHHIPAAVWDIASRGEFLTAYTPYQAEASQGTLQLLYEYQSMMSELTGMDVSNASLYDGASALAEAVLMAARLSKHTGAHRVLVPATLHPLYRETIETILGNQHIELVTLPYDINTGVTDLNALKQYENQSITAMIIAQPNFFGQLEPVNELTDFAHDNQMLAIACVNPTSLAILKSPGSFGEKGVDIVCGEGQSLGVPLASGGPYFGFLTSKSAYVRQMPGRIVGQTLDKEGNIGYSLTLQAREQHIRRAKATSNICTNQGLLVTAATIYMAMMGAEGLANVAKSCWQNTQKLIQRLVSIPGVQQQFKGPGFHETVLTLPKPASEVLSALAQYHINGGLDVSAYYPELKGALLVCATELTTDADIDLYYQALSECLS